MLRKYIANPSHMLDYQPIQISKNISYEEQPFEIIDEKEQVLKTKVISLAKVCWINHFVDEAIWERKVEMFEKYPQLIHA